MGPRELTLGFVPLVDCAPLAVAMSMGLSGLAAPLDALMVMSVNGTVLGVSRALAARMDGRVFGDAQARALAAAAGGPLRIGVPFPFSMHRLLLDYWLERAPPLRDLVVEIVTVPPPRMAGAVAGGELDAFFVGEPWGSAAVARGAAELLLPGSAIRGFAPEKVLAARRDWVAAEPEAVRALMRAVHKAAAWLDTRAYEPLAPAILSRSSVLNRPTDTIEPSLSGQLIPAPGAAPVRVPRFLVFQHHAATFPWRSQAVWIAARLGADAAGQDAARARFRPDLYRRNFGPIGVDLPGASERIEGTMRHATAVASTRGHMILGPDAFFDGAVFDMGAGV